MEERALGTSGLHVSCLTLGTMTWGRDIDLHEAREIFDLYYEFGGRLIDTADIFAEGASEKIVGQVIADYPEIMVSTKAGNVNATRRRNNSRAHLLSALEASMKRLDRSYIDIWHLNVWDELTPIDESLSALEIAVTSGRVRYVGISNFSGWQTALTATRAQEVISVSNALVSHQVEYSLLQRGIEREVLPASEALGLGVMAWSPLGRGVLTGKYRHSTPADSRAASPHFSGYVAPYLVDKPRAITEAVCTAADGLQLTPIQIALNWVLTRRNISSAVIGVRTSNQMRNVLACLNEEIPEEIIRALNEVSQPDRGYPEYGWNQS